MGSAMEIAFGALDLSRRARSKDKGQVRGLSVSAGTVDCRAEGAVLARVEEGPSFVSAHDVSLLIVEIDRTLERLASSRQAIR